MIPLSAAYLPRGGDPALLLYPASSHQEASVSLHPSTHHSQSLYLGPLFPGFLGPDVDPAL